MTVKLADRVLETSTTQGTGTINLDGPTGGFQGFLDGVTTGSKVPYVIDDGTDWEVGIGTITSGSPDTLSRDTVRASSNSDAAVNWGPGTRNVRLSPVADLSPARDENLNDTSAFDGSAGGTGDAHTVSLFPTPLAYSDGMTITYRAPDANTTAVTVNVDSLGSKSIKFGGLDPAAGDISADDIIMAVYDATAGWFEAILLSSIRGAALRSFVDDDTFATATDDNVASAESTKAYVDNSVAPLASGRSLQFDYTKKTDTWGNTTSSFVDITGLTVTVTTENDDDIVVIGGYLSAAHNNSTDNTGMLKLFRDSTEIGQGDSGGSRERCFAAFAVTGQNQTQTVPISYVDVPGAAGTYTYKLQGKGSNDGDIWVNRTNNDTNTSVTARPASILTAEVRAS